MKSKKRKKVNRKAQTEIRDYDRVDTSGFIDKNKPIHFKDLGLTLPDVPPTQVVSMAKRRRKSA